MLMGSRRTAAGPFSSQTLGPAVAEIHCTIKRSEGVNYGLPALGDDVALTVAVEGIDK
jgi:hypothetical protein